MTNVDEIVAWHKAEQRRAEKEASAHESRRDWESMGLAEARATAHQRSAEHIKKVWGGK